MSDHDVVHPSPAPSRTAPSSDLRDRGMNLPELLIAVSIVGLIIAVLSTSIVVTLRQQDNTGGRLNVARAEQSVGMWMPADLASADLVDTSPQASPCGAAVCDGIVLSNGSNVLMLSWSVDGPGGVTSTTNVSYHFTLTDQGEYELWRVECIDGACTSSTVLDNLPGPPGGADFTPGVLHGDACAAEPNPVACTRPDWVIIVSEPLAPDAIDENDIVDSDSERKDANRVIVTINGGGDADGAGGGINQISITAGGTVRSDIEADSIQGAPTFLEARSRCGGPISLVIDESNSIGGAISNVEAGVRTFIESLAGTPVQLQVVRFETYSGILGSTDWHRYYDMTNPSDVSALLASVSDLQGSWSTYPRGGTNWEEGLFRTFYNADASVAQTIPDTIVFFTDGVPTFDRLVQRTSPGVLPALPGDPGDQWDDSTGSSYNQVAFNRANYIANKFRRSVRFIGVGVGAGIETNQRSTWIVDPGAGYVWELERGYVRYQEIGEGYETNLDFEAGYDPESRVDFERYSWGRWRNTSPGNYYANNWDSGSWDGYRINGTRGWYNVSQWDFDNYAHLIPNDWKYDDWYNIDAAEYYADNTTADWYDGYQIDGTRSWEEVDQYYYDLYNTDPGESDGWRTGGSSSTEWITETEYLANNTTPDSSDGYHDTGTENWVSASQALAWAPWPGSQEGPSDQYRSVKTYPAGGPYDGYDTAVTAETQNRVILARLIAGNDYGTPAIWDAAANGGAGGYTNIEVADMYLEPDWNRFPGAMQAIALGECGGTLTIQTKFADGTPAPDPFRYQNSAVTDSSGDPVEMEPSVVTTDAVFRTGTFDFAIPGGQYITVDVLPQNFSELTGYTPGSWSCKAGVDNRSVNLLTVPDSGGWQGIQVQVAANEAVSCTLTVS